MGKISKLLVILGILLLLISFPTFFSIGFEIVTLDFAYYLAILGAGFLFVGAIPTIFKRSIKTKVSKAEKEKINCPNCKAENDINSKFCISCGKSINKICSNCKLPSPITAKFCTSCGKEF